MIKITVKTIESNNYDFDVDENISVKDFKEVIASKVEISADLQRLIFCGRVLADDKLLKDYEINDGKVVHLVKRAPPISSSPRPGSAPTSAHSSPRHTHNGRRFGAGRTPDDNSYLVGAFTIPQEAFNPNGFQQILQNMVQNMGDIGRNATVMSRTSEDGSSVDVQINLSQMPPQNECRQRIAQTNRFIGYINAIIEVIERPDNIPGFSDIGGNPNTGTFTIDANNMGSLEAQLAAQATAAASNALGLPLMSGLFGSTQRPQNNTSQNQSQNTNNNTNNNTTNNTNNNNSGQQRSQPVVASEVNELMNSAFRAQERLRPHLQRLQQLMTIEGPLNEQQISEASSLQRNCQRANHHLAHVFHLISDLSINFSSQNLSVGVVQSTQPSMESVSVSVPFAPQTTNTESSARSQGQNTGTTANNSNTSNQASEEITATASTTTHSTTSVPRFSQSFSGDRSSSVYSTQSPIVVMEVGSTVERIQIPTSNANNNQSDNPRSNPSTRPLFIPPFDPFLQCTSPFTVPEIRPWVSVGITTARNSRQSNQNQNNNNNNNNNNTNNGTTFNETQTSNIPFASLGQLLNGIISGFVGQTTGSANNTNPNNMPSNTPTGEPSLNVDPTLIDLMGRLNNQRPPQETQGEGEGEGEDNQTNMTDMFMSFVNGILQIISGGQTNSINVANFLNQLEGFSYVEGENIANDIFMVMARVLSFQDLFHIFAGNSEPLNRVREPLKDFVQTNILEGNPPNRENIDRAITSIINSWRPGLEVMISDLSLVPAINIMATIEHFLRFNLNRILQFFLVPPQQDYGNTFFAITREILIDLISLSQVCFNDGVVALPVMVGSFIEHISSELNPAIQEWMRSVAIRHLNEYINNNNSEQSPNTQSYIVRNNSESDNSMTAANESNEEVVNETDSIEAENVEFIDAQSDFDDNINSNNSSVQMEASFNEIRCEIPAVLIGSEAWHSSLPPDWVPIITNDLERQRRQTIPRPFSDAYLNGVSKKRKIERRSLNLRDSLQTALISSGVRPIVQTNTEDIINQISANSGLNFNFDELVRSAVRERIVEDDDFTTARTQNPDRFSSSHKYFNPKK